MDLLQLLRQPRLVITGALSTYTLRSFQTDVFKLIDNNDQCATVVLASEGGSVQDGMAIHDLIRLLAEDGIDVSILVNGQCSSTASWLITAVATEHRYATRESRFMVHPFTITRDNKTLRCEPELPADVAARASSIFQDDVNALAAVTECYTLQERSIQLLCEGITLSEAEIRALYTTESFFGAQQALEAGLIGHIL